MEGMSPTRSILYDFWPSQLFTATTLPFLYFFAGGQPGYTG
jgi:hypothetical protein